MIHATVAPGARLVLPWPRSFNALAYVLSGNALVGPERRPVGLGHLSVFGDGDLLVAEAAPTQEGPGSALELFVLGGRPIGEPVAWWGPFVRNTDAEVQQAVHDFRAGRLGHVPEEAAPPTEAATLTTDSPLG